MPLQTLNLHLKGYNNLKITLGMLSNLILKLKIYLSLFLFLWLSFSFDFKNDFLWFELKIFILKGWGGGRLIFTDIFSSSLKYYSFNSCVLITGYLELYKYLFFGGLISLFWKNFLMQSLFISAFEKGFSFYLSKLQKY